MKPMSVVLASTKQIEPAMMARLQEYFRQVAIADSMDELRSSVLKNRAETVFVDLGVVTLEQVAQLHAELAHIRIICTHPDPVDALQQQCRAAGALDCVNCADVRAMVLAAQVGIPITRAQAA